MNCERKENGIPRRGRLVPYWLLRLVGAAITQSVFVKGHTDPQPSLVALPVFLSYPYHQHGQGAETAFAYTDAPSTCW